ncbi:MAG: DNA polymerase III subunit alpha [Vagococcus sp.]
MNLGQLQVLTSYSLLASTNRIPELVSRTKELGYSSSAITDINAMHGVVEFHQTCLRNEIKPLIGLTLIYQSKEDSSREYQVILLAKNNVGYHHLMKLSTVKLEQDSRAPFYLETIAEYLSDMVIIFPWEHNELASYFDMTQSKQPIQPYLDWLAQFHNVDIYQGISIKAEEEEDRELCQQFCCHYGIPLVALHQVKYLYPSDDFSVEVLKHIDSGGKMSIDIENTSGSYYLPEKKVFEELFKRQGLEDALLNNEHIIAMCHVDIKLNQTLLPAFPIDKEVMAHEYLRELCFEGLKQRGMSEESIYIDRLEMELSVIHDMGYDDYFLIVWDVMKYARDQDIVTACRGSAAGSLVSYVLKITDVDPIEYGLLFERFLNKERYTMPDIDMDIPDNRREELLQYVNRKYGYHKVAQIATFGTLAAKMALRDVSRVFGLSQNESNAWSNAIPNVLKITLSEAYEQSGKLRDLVTHSEKNKLLFDTAKRIEGLPRHISTHAAGVVISDRDLTDIIPLQEGSNGIPLTQLAMGDVEAIGLLKMDFLGLRNLAIIGNTLQSIERLYHKKIKLEDIPLDDPETLELFRKGETIGVFQFESDGIKNVLRKLGPTSIEDIASVNALYRPGPMQHIDLFVDRKKGNVPIVYPHDNLKPILDMTYGIIVYQEQIMKIASLMAGFSLGQADILRRAISKKKKDVLDEERRHFVEGSKQQGYTEEVANEVYDYIEHFANYGFNRSHAVVYSVVAYQMAYLKVHYPEAFFSALLHSVRHNLSKVKEYITEAKRYGVTILPPDINKSDYSFTLSKGRILFGLSSLKGIRRDFIQNILETRKKDGPYKSLENFLIRINGKWLKDTTILPLIYIGAFDSIHGNRRQLVVDLDGLIRNIQYSGGSMDLLGILSLKKEPIADYSIEEKLNQEVDYLGTYLSGHPVDQFANLQVGRLISQIDGIQVGKTVDLLVYVTSVKKIRTKKGESMAFLSGTDATGDINITLFPTLFRKIGMSVEENTVYMVNGKVETSRYNQEIQLIANSCEKAQDVIPLEKLKKCYIKIEQENDNNGRLNELKQVLLSHSGSVPVVLIFPEQHKNILLDKRYWVFETPDMLQNVFSVLGNNTIVFK